MSGKPNPPQIAELRAAVGAVADCDRDIARLHNLIAESQATLEATRTTRGKQAKLVLDLMGRMDVAANHNTGWEQRVVWFLAELTTQAEAEGERKAREDS